jgi:hypothetical protein
MANCWIHSEVSTWHVAHGFWDGRHVSWPARWGRDLPRDGGFLFEKHPVFGVGNCTLMSPNMLQYAPVTLCSSEVETSIPRFRHRKPGTQHEASHQTSPNTIVRFSWHVVPVSGEGPWISYFHIFYVFLCVLFYVSVFLLIKLSFLSSCRPPLGVPFSTSRAGLRAGYGNLHEWSWAHTYGCQSACVSTNGPVHNSYVNKYVYIHILIYSNNSVYIYMHHYFCWYICLCMSQSRYVCKHVM